jgi:hypothetical protein
LLLQHGRTLFPVLLIKTLILSGLGTSAEIVAGIVVIVEKSLSSQLIWLGVSFFAGRLAYGGIFRRVNKWGKPVGQKGSHVFGGGLERRDRARGEVPCII